MSSEATPQAEIPLLKTLPGDDVRQIMWRLADRFDLQMLVQSTRSVARGIVARLVAEGNRNTHDWTPRKAEMLAAFDESGVTAAFMDPEFGGYIEGPKNFPMALVAFELSWVDAGAATASLANNLALAPIHEKGTHEQKARYMHACVPPAPGENRKVWRGSFVLTEPLPYVGADTGMVSGRISVAEWKDGEEPMLQVEKRGRFITNMGYADFVTAAVETGDPRIKTSCMVILESGDPGKYDRGTPTKKMVHQLSSTSDPVFSQRVPASRIIGGYTVQDGVIVPNFSHGEVIEAVFARTRITAGVMTVAKLLSVIEPVIRYQRGRFRGAASIAPGSPRFDLGLQQREDSTHRLADIWASGEAGTSLAFATARVFDDFDPVERRKDEHFKAQGIKGRAEMKALAKVRPLALEYVKLMAKPEAERDAARVAELEGDLLVQYLAKEAVANVVCPACKLWNTGVGTNMMREAVSLMGGYGITEDCPGFVGQKWMDAQLEATYEGPEAVQRRQLSVTMTNEVFQEWFRTWIAEMRRIAARRPGSGACTLASAMELWLWTYDYLQKGKDADGKALYNTNRQGVVFPLADALSWLLASRYQILDTIELEEKGRDVPTLEEGYASFVRFFYDLCHVQAARSAGEVGRICAELVHGYQRHPSWDDAIAYRAEDLKALESVAPGMCCGTDDVVDESGCHPDKAGPCVRQEELAGFDRLRSKLDGCLTGSRLAKDRASQSIASVMIPEALDYPL